jgi:hypothetical protein
VRVAGKVRPPARGLYWGAFVPHAPLRRGALSRFAGTVGRVPAIVMWYQSWYGHPAFPAKKARRLASKGIVPMLTWEPWRHDRVERRHGRKVDQSRFRLRNIARGRFDRYVRRFARQIRDYGGPVMLRPMHEMDGDWYPWGGTVNGNTPRQFVAAWRHLHRIFHRVGARNVTWVWSVNHESLPRVSKNRIANYWPGRNFVDWVGWSGFNRGPTEPYNYWQTFDQVGRRRYLELLAFHKPIALTETAAPEFGGDKAAWIRDAFVAIRARYPKLVAMVWFDKRGSEQQDWRVNSSPASLRAFRQALRLPWVRSAPRAAR